MSGIKNFQNIDLPKIISNHLTAMANSYKIKNCYKVRATMVFEAAKGVSFKTIGALINLSYETVSEWVKRFISKLDQIKKYK